MQHLCCMGFDFPASSLDNVKVIAYSFGRLLDHSNDFFHDASPVFTRSRAQMI